MYLSKFIHEYLDGELNDSQKEVLFTELSKNPELRIEFDKQVQLHIIAQNDMNTISVPIESTSMIFRSLGFSIPSNLYLSEGASSSSSISINNGAEKFIVYLKKVFPIAIIGILVVLLTTTIYNTIEDGVFVSENSSSKLNRSKLPVVNSISGESLAEFTDSQLNLRINNSDFSSYNYQEHLLKSKILDLLHSNLASDAIMRRSVNSGNSIQSGTSTVNEFANLNVLSHIDESHAFENNNVDNGYNPKEFYLNSKSINANSAANNFVSNKIHYSPLIIDAENLNTRTRIDNTHFNLAVLHDFAYNEYPANSFQNLNKSILEKIYLSLMYKLDRNHSIGLQFGKERFPQEFSKTNIEEFIQTTTPILWIGAAYRLSVPEIGLYNILEPYTQIVAAYTSIGPMFRPQLGVQLYLYNFSITFGGEYNILIYNVEGNLFTSQKIGLVYGLNYHF